MKKLITLPLLISMTGLLFANQSLAITQSQMQMRATATCDSYASMSRIASPGVVYEVCLNLPTLSGDSGAVLTLSTLPVMHHAQRQSQWQCKAMTKAKITPKPHTGSQRSRCKQNTRYCINKQPCNCQAYAPSHTGNPLFRPVYCICTAI